MDRRHAMIVEFENPPGTREPVLVNGGFISSEA